MLNRQRLQPEPVVVTIGFAAHSDGRGIAYAAVDAEPAVRDVERVGSIAGTGSMAGAGSCGYLRVPFALRSRAALQGRDVTYAAVNAVAETLLSQGLRSVVFRLEDERLATDLRERGALPAPLTVPYVALRCRLNRFTAARVEPADESLVRDLTSRARAEATLHIAA